MPYWNFEYTKAVIYTVVKVGGGIGQDPATEVTHLRLNQPPVFSSDTNISWSRQKEVKEYRRIGSITTHRLQQPDI